MTNDYEKVLDVYKRIISGLPNYLTENNVSFCALFDILIRGLKDPDVYNDVFSEIAALSDDSITFKAKIKKYGYSFLKIRRQDDMIITVTKEPSETPLDEPRDRKSIYQISENGYVKEYHEWKIRSKEKDHFIKRLYINNDKGEQIEVSELLEDGSTFYGPLSEERKKDYAKFSEIADAEQLEIEANSISSPQAK